MLAENFQQIKGYAGTQSKTESLERWIWIRQPRPNAPPQPHRQLVWNFKTY